MKLNCDAFSDWLKARKAKKRAIRGEWHKKFVFYHRVGHGDCRVFEVMERRRVYGYGEHWFWGDDVRMEMWEYRPL